MNNEIQRHGIFHFYEDWPDELLESVLTSLKTVEWLLPPWCISACVFWDDEEVEGVCHADIDYDYRRYKINFGPKWLTQDTETRREILTHEFIHAHNILISQFAEREIERLIPEDEAPKYRASVLEALSIRVEQATCDLTHCINQRIK